jgi:hypothetical protein
MATIVAVKTVAIALAMNYGVHVSSSLAYGYLCVPQSVADIARSFVTTASPICSFLLSTMTVTQGNFATIITTTLAAMAAGALKPA